MMEKEDDDTEVQLFRYSPSKLEIVTHSGKKTAQLLCFAPLGHGRQEEEPKIVTNQVDSDQNDKSSHAKSEALHHPGPGPAIQVVADIRELQELSTLVGLDEDLITLQDCRKFKYADVHGFHNTTNGPPQRNKLKKIKSQHFKILNNVNKNKTGGLNNSKMYLEVERIETELKKVVNENIYLRQQLQVYESRIMLIESENLETKMLVENLQEKLDSSIKSENIMRQESSSIAEARDLFKKQMLEKHEHELAVVNQTKNDEIYANYRETNDLKLKLSLNLINEQKLKDKLDITEENLNCAQSRLELEGRMNELTKQNLESQSIITQNYNSIKTLILEKEILQQELQKTVTDLKESTSHGEEIEKTIMELNNELKKQLDVNKELERKNSENAITIEKLVADIANAQREVPSVRKLLEEKLEDLHNGSSERSNGSKDAKFSTLSMKTSCECDINDEVIASKLQSVSNENDKLKLLCTSLKSDNELLSKQHVEEKDALDEVIAELKNVQNNLMQDKKLNYEEILRLDKSEKELQGELILAEKSIHDTKLQLQEAMALKNNYQMELANLKQNLVESRRQYEELNECSQKSSQEQEDQLYSLTQENTLKTAAVVTLQKKIDCILGEKNKNEFNFKKENERLNQNTHRLESALKEQTEANIQLKQEETYHENQMKQLLFALKTSLNHIKSLRNLIENNNSVKSLYFDELSLSDLLHSNENTENSRMYSINNCLSDIRVLNRQLNDTLSDSECGTPSFLNTDALNYAASKEGASYETDDNSDIDTPSLCISEVSSRIPID